MLFHSFKLFYIVLLVILFVVYFGVPNLQKFLEQKTIFLESKIKDKMLERIMQYKNYMRKYNFGNWNWNGNPKLLYFLFI